MLNIHNYRFHAFRKMTSSQLPPTDCHCTLRSEILQSPDTPMILPICFSIAWDWQYCGITREKIYQYSEIVRDIALENRKHKLRTLGLLETSLYRWASNILRSSVLSDEHCITLAGIQPTLEKMYEFHKRVIHDVEHSGYCDTFVCSLHQEPVDRCNLCKYELSNHFLRTKTEPIQRYCLWCYDENKIKYAKKKANKGCRPLLLCFMFKSLKNESKMLESIRDALARMP